MQLCILQSVKFCAFYRTPSTCFRFATARSPSPRGRNFPLRRLRRPPSPRGAELPPPSATLTTLPEPRLRAGAESQAFGHPSQDGNQQKNTRRVPGVLVLFF